MMHANTKPSANQRRAVWDQATWDDKRTEVGDAVSDFIRTVSRELAFSLSE